MCVSSAVQGLQHGCGCIEAVQHTSGLQQLPSGSVLHLTPFSPGGPCCSALVCLSQCSPPQWHEARSEAAAALLLVVVPLHCCCWWCCCCRYKAEKLQLDGRLFWHPRAVGGTQLPELENDGEFVGPRLLQHTSHHSSSSSSSTADQLRNTTPQLLKMPKPKLHTAEAVLFG